MHSKFHQCIHSIGFIYIHHAIRNCNSGIKNPFSRNLYYNSHWSWSYCMLCIFGFHRRIKFHIHTHILHLRHYCRLRKNYLNLTSRILRLLHILIPIFNLLHMLKLLSKLKWPEQRIYLSFIYSIKLFSYNILNWILIIIYETIIE